MNTVLLVLQVLLAMAVSILMVLSGVGIHEKAGEPGWKAALPIINTISFFDIMSSSNVFWGMLFTGGYVLFLGCLIPDAAGLIKTILIVVGAVSCFCCYAYNCISGARKFGKSIAFGAGLVFLPIIFFPILSFGDAVYKKNP